MRIPLEIKKISDPAGETNFRAVVYIEDAIKGSNTSEQLKEIETEYVELVEKSKKLVGRIQQTKVSRADAKLHWSLGDLMIRFLDKLEKRGYLLTNVRPTFSRDICLSRRYVGYHIQLRKDYPNIESLNSEIGWSKYQELLDINDIEKRAILAEKIQNKEIVTRDQLRRFKKNI